MHKEKVTFFKIFFTLSLLISLPLVFILTNSPDKKQDIRSKAVQSTPTPGKIIYVPFSFSKDKDDDEILDFKKKARIRNGFIPPIQATTGPQYTAEILRSSGQKIATVTFSLPQLVAVDGLDKTRKKGKAELKKVTRNNQGIVLPYHPNASYLSIKNSKGETIDTISIQELPADNNIVDPKEIRGDKKDRDSSINLWQIDKAFAGNGRLNIAILGDNYSGDNLHFQKDVNDIVSGLLSVDPFKSNAGSLIFYPQLSTVPLCSWINSALSCNDTLSLQEASSIPYDKIYVLYNGPYSGYAYLGATLAYGTNATDMPTSVKQGLFIHELGGHVIGGLMDEYSYGTTGASYAPNCSDLSSCPSWSSIAGLGCFSTCGFANLYRATDNSSVMNTAFLTGTLSFDIFSVQIVNGKLVSLIGASPPTATLPPVIPTPTVSPSVSPITSPTLTIAPTRSSIGTLFTEPTFTPTPSLTPIPSSTPTPSPITSCSFPNFCTQAKYCETENILPISCGTAGQVCCKFQIQPTEAPFNPQAVEVTPTPLQIFEPLPTIPPQGDNEPTTMLTIMPSPTAFSSPSITPHPTAGEITITIIPHTNTPTLRPSLITPPQYNPPTISPTPTKSFQENYPVYPTPTSFVVENIIFERPTPTPSPKIGLVDILAAPSRFVNNLLRNFFSLFSNK